MNEQDDVDFRNKYTELVCDKLLNYKGKGKFSSDKMQQCADLILIGKRAGIVENAALLKRLIRAQAKFIKYLEGCFDKSPLRSYSHHLKIDFLKTQINK